MITFVDMIMAGMKQAKVSGDPQRQQTMHQPMLIAYMRSAEAAAT